MATSCSAVNLDKVFINTPKGSGSKSNHNDNQTEFGDHLRNRLKGSADNKEQCAEKWEQPENNDLIPIFSKNEDEELLPVSYDMPTQLIFLPSIQIPSADNLIDLSVTEISAESALNSSQQLVFTTIENSEVDDFSALQSVFKNFVEKTDTLEQGVTHVNRTSIILAADESAGTKKSVTRAPTGTEKQTIVVNHLSFHIPSEESKNIFVVAETMNNPNMLGAEKGEENLIPDQNLSLDSVEMVNQNKNELEQLSSDELNRFKHQDSSVNMDILIDKSNTAFRGVIESGNYLSNKSTDGSNLEPTRIIEQIVKQMDMNIQPDNPEITIRLKPEHLGKMTIQLSWEEGKITARFITESQEVKNLLDSNIIILKQNLEANGIKVEKTEINYQLNGGEGFSQRQHFNGSGQQTGQEGSQQSSNSYRLAAENVAWAEEEPYLMNFVDNLDEDGLISSGAQLNYLI